MDLPELLRDVSNLIAPSGLSYWLLMLLQKRSILPFSKNWFMEVVKTAGLTKSIYGGSQSMQRPKINLRRGLPQKINPFLEADPLEDLSRLKGPRPINSPHQTLTIKGNLLSLLLHLLATTQKLGSLLCWRLHPIFRCAWDSFPFSPMVVTPRVEQQPPLPLHASLGPASLCATPLHTTRVATTPSRLLFMNDTRVAVGGHGGTLHVLWACFFDVWCLAPCRLDLMESGGGRPYLMDGARSDRRQPDPVEGDNSRADTALSISLSLPLCITLPLSCSLC